MPFEDVWGNIITILDDRMPDWQQRIMQAGQVAAVEARNQGHMLTDNEIFEGIIKAVLSNSTDWARIENVLPELQNLFHGFDLNFYSNRTPFDIENTFLPWFLEHNAGSMTMKQNLTRLIQTANKLLQYSGQHQSLEGFLGFLLNNNGNNPINLVRQIGSPASPYKLPAVGIPIAAESMKNIGFDVAKPDRHINRAMGCFNLVHFANWRDRSGTKPPQATEGEMINVMQTMQQCAIEVNSHVTFLDNAIWLLCARSGLHFKNTDLCNLTNNE